jgi:hypothetical protein
MDDEEGQKERERESVCVCEREREVISYYCEQALFKYLIQ